MSIQRKVRYMLFVILRYYIYSKQKTSFVKEIKKKKKQIFENVISINKISREQNFKEPGVVFFQMSIHIISIS